jgi:hypothetical protein
LEEQTIDKLKVNPHAIQSFLRTSTVGRGILALAVCVAMTNFASPLSSGQAATGSELPALAADVTGTWTSHIKTNDGNELLITFVFKQEGAKLTGTVATPRETANISDGKVDREKIFFTAAFPNSTFTYDGTIAGDEIKVSAKVPDFPSSDITLQRSK